VPWRFSLASNANARLYVLKWYTPLEGIAGKMLGGYAMERPFPTRAFWSAELLLHRMITFCWSPERRAVQRSI
jgi:hypothetical protein